MIVYRDKVLLAHSTNSPWWRSYTPPKGGVEKGEEDSAAAARELMEETGIRVDSSSLKEQFTVKYDNGKRTYKEVIVFVHRINDLTEIGLTSEIVPFSQLQTEEIDEARFFTREEAEKKLLPRYTEHVTSRI